jgi:hypothetical protein
LISNLETLKQNSNSKWNMMLEPLTQAKYQTALDRTPAEQLAKNKESQAVLRQWLDEEITPEDLNERKQFWEEFREIMDSTRSRGCGSDY